MRLTVTTKGFLLSAVWIVITICEVGILRIQADNIIIAASFITCFNLIAQIITLKVNEMSGVSSFSAFILCYYLMHFGEVLMMGFFPEYKYDYVNYISTYMNQTSETFFNTILMCIVCINMFFIGGILIYKNYEYNDGEKIPNEWDNNEKHTAKIMFYLLLPIRLYLDVTGIIKAALGGYAGIIGSSSGPGVFSALGIMWYVALALYYLELKSPLKKKRLLLISVLYICFTMLTGKRGHALIGIFSLLIVAIQEKQVKFKIKHLILIIVAGYVGLTFIDVIFSMRHYSISYFLSNFSMFIKESTSTNILLETIGTFGETLYTPYLVLDGYGVNFTPFFGECFIKSLASIVPDAFGWFKDINNEAIFQKMLGTTHTIGGSFAGDMYYNFGQFYPLMSMIFGAIICRMSSKSEFAIKSNNYQSAVFSIAFCSLSLWWIRDSIGNLTREVVWIIIMYFVLDSLVNRRRAVQ